MQESSFFKESSQEEAQSSDLSRAHRTTVEFLPDVVRIKLKLPLAKCTSLKVTVFGSWQSPNMLKSFPMHPNLQEAMSADRARLEKLFSPLKWLSQQYPI